MKYIPLEPNSVQYLGTADALSFDGGSTSFFATTSFLYTLFFVLIIGASFYRYLVAGILRMQASESSIRQSNDVIKKATLGLLGVFSLFLILVTLNKNLVTGDVLLNSFSQDGTVARSGSLPIQGQVTSGGVPVSCDAPNLVIQKLQSQGGLCGGVTCNALTSCSYQKYLPIIEQNTQGNEQLKKMIIVTLCKESKANPNATHINQNGTYDCGLMQVNQGTPCETNPSDLSQENNIKTGIAKMKQKITAASQVYTNIPSTGGAFASYNCCANGTVPYAPSADCNSASGFPFSIPKWACPINPGNSTYNMCSVKSYACELSVCMGQL